MIFRDFRRSSEIQALEAELEQYRTLVAAMTEVCRSAAAGDLEPRVHDLGLPAELDECRHALNHLLDLSDAYVREASASLTHAAEGKFYRRVLARGMKGAFRAGAHTINRAAAVMAEGHAKLEAAAEHRLRLATDFEAAVQSVTVQVAAAATELQSTASLLADSAGLSAAESDVAANASSQVSSSAASIAAATEELTATVEEIERQVNASTDATHAAVEQSTHADGTVRGLDEASRQIEEVVTMINYVAGQTRLLALNATIEAARAGEAGKGFGVVAAEVKNLANQTAEATGRIGHHVTAIQTAAGRTSKAIGAIGGAIAKLGEVNGYITAAVREQRHATVDISRSIQSTAHATEDVSKSVDSVRHTTRETSEAAHQLQAAAAELSNLGEKLKSEVDGFLGAIRGDQKSGDKARRPQRISDPSRARGAVAR
ncbi:methyl-accepting chemotaxis protein [Myxococcota bacterium]|nr:methyl-accepting chemotaxis protein [Myxococcota bacterium]